MIKLGYFWDSIILSVFVFGGLTTKNSTSLSLQNNGVIVMARAAKMGATAIFINSRGVATAKPINLALVSANVTENHSPIIKASASRLSIVSSKLHNIKSKPELVGAVANVSNRPNINSSSVISHPALDISYIFSSSNLKSTEFQYIHSISKGPLNSVSKTSLGVIQTKNKPTLTNLRVASTAPFEPTQFPVSFNGHNGDLRVSQGLLPTAPFEPIQFPVSFNGHNGDLRVSQEAPRLIMAPFDESIQLSTNQEILNEITITPTMFSVVIDNFSKFAIGAKSKLKSVFSSRVSNLEFVLDDIKYNIVGLYNGNQAKILLSSAVYKMSQGRKINIFIPKKVIANLGGGENANKMITSIVSKKDMELLLSSTPIIWKPFIFERTEKVLGLLTTNVYSNIEKLYVGDFGRVSYLNWFI